MTTRRWGGLDGLRGVAVISVVLFHLDIAPEGFLGVDVFFVLSGFLITRLLLAEYERTGTIRLRRFTIRRLVRLYPALVAVCVFCVLVATVAGRQIDAMVHDALLSLGYVSNLFPMELGLLTHTWTLSLEEQFYLVWPVLLMFRFKRGSMWAWLPSLVVVVGILAADLLTDSAVLHTYVRAMGLPIGCMLALAGPSVIGALSRLGWMAGAAFVVIIFLPLPDWLTTETPISIGALLAAPMVARLVHRPAPIMEGRLIRWFGLRSYSLYLWHLPIISLVVFQSPESVPVWLRPIVGVGASLVFAELSYRYVEQPFLRLRDRRRPAPAGDRGPTGAATSGL